MAHREKGVKFDSVATAISSGNADSAVDILDIDSQDKVEIKYIKLKYPSAGTDTVVDLHDESAGTGQGNLSDKIENFYVSGGDRITIENPTYEAVENDIVADLDTSLDKTLYITIGVKYLTV